MPASVKNYYETLGVSEDASPGDIKKAFKRLAKEWHPDRKSEDEKPAAEAKFKEINEAFSVLADDKKRQEYDFARKNPGAHGGFSPPPGFVNFEDLFQQHFGVNDFFDSFFGRSQGPRRQRQKVNDDINVEITLEPQDSLKDIRKKISYTQKISCEKCSGAGGFDPETCVSCAGRGVMQQKQRTPMGTMVHESMCPRCHGSGRKFSKSCSQCAGSGHISKKKSMEINIDKGSSGHMVFSGHGHKMHKDVPAGNLVVTVLYRHTKSFNIINQKGDLLTMLAVNPVRAIVGGRCFVKGLDGKRISFELSPGVSEGTKIRIADQGMYLQGSSSRGDLYVQIAFDVPIESGEKKDILLQYLKSTNENYI